MRKANIDAAFGGEAADALPARGALGIRAARWWKAKPYRCFHLSASLWLNGSLSDGSLSITGDHNGVQQTLTADEMIVATGFRPDLSLLREIRLTLDPWLESSGTIGPLIN